MNREDFTRIKTDDRQSDRGERTDTSFAKRFPTSSKSIFEKREIISQVVALAGRSLLSLANHKRD